MPTVPPPDAVPFQPGDVIDGKYRCEEVLGVGGMGAVVRATHLLRKADVAIKFMNAKAAARPDLVERFLNEAVAASRIDSEHVVRIHDVSRLPDGTPFMVMEHLRGEELAALLAREGRPGLEDVARAVHLILQILLALQVAHAAGIVHRDMKPSNCFVISREGDSDFVKLFDFGISKLAEAEGDAARLTRTHALLGTPLYMAPEQAMSARKADARTDLFAAGVILYELLCGRTPFRPDDESLAGLFVQLVSTDAPSLAERRADLPPGLVAAVHRALAREPSERYQSAAEMAEGLAPWADARSGETLRRIRARASAAPGPSTQAPRTVPASPPSEALTIPLGSSPAAPPAPSGELTGARGPGVVATATTAITPTPTVHEAGLRSARRGRARTAWLAGVVALGVGAIVVVLVLQPRASSVDASASAPALAAPPSAPAATPTGAPAGVTTSTAADVPTTASASGSASAAQSTTSAVAASTPAPHTTSVAPRTTTAGGTTSRVPLGQIGIEH